MIIEKLKKRIEDLEKPIEELELELDIRRGASLADADASRGQVHQRTRDD